MKHLKAINAKASRLEAQANANEQDVFALQSGKLDPSKQPHVPVGCSLAFYPGWEVDSAGGTAGYVSPLSVICTIAMPTVSGPHRFPIT